jgi:methylase of polypeptide subunit release factors
VVSDGGPLLELLQGLKRLHYQFAAITPLTHARVLARRRDAAPDLRDIFGWSRPFAPADLEPGLLELLERAPALDHVGARLRSRVRVASLDGDLFLHSAFPTESGDAVFFGPDTYRFARFLEAQIPRLPGSPGSVADMGAGSGAGGVVAAHLLPGAKLTLVDVNPAALRFAQANAAAAGVEAQLLQSDRLPAGAELIIANPPYMIDPARRAYRDGGDLLGGAVALDWARQALTSGATMLLYTGAAFVAGDAPLLEALRQACSEAGASLAFEEIDPDVFGEELERPDYAEVERIAAIGVLITPRRD